MEKTKHDRSKTPKTETIKDIPDQPHKADRKDLQRLTKLVTVPSRELRDTVNKEILIQSTQTAQIKGKKQLVSHTG